MYILFRKVHLAIAGVPPVELFVVVQPFGPEVEPAVPELKFSENIDSGRDVPRLELEYKLKRSPGHIDVRFALAVTTGIAITLIVTACGVVFVHPLELNV